MRKTLIAVVAAAVLVAGLTACGDDNKDNSSSTTAPTVTQTDTTGTDTQTQTQTQTTQTETQTGTQEDKSGQSEDKGSSTTSIEDGLKQARESCIKGAENIPDKTQRESLIERCKQIGQ